MRVLWYGVWGMVSVQCNPRREHCDKASASQLLGTPGHLPGGGGGRMNEHDAIGHIHIQELRCVVTITG